MFSVWGVSKWTGYTVLPSVWLKAQMAVEENVFNLKWCKIKRMSVWGLIWHTLGAKNETMKMD